MSTINGFYIYQYQHFLVARWQRIHLPINAGDAGLIPGSGRPLEKEWQPTPVFLPETSHGQRSLAGYSPWGHKELDMTE